MDASTDGTRRLSAATVTTSYPLFRQRGLTALCGFLRGDRCCVVIRDAGTHGVVVIDGQRATAGKLGLEYGAALTLAELATMSTTAEIARVFTTADESERAIGAATARYVRDGLSADAAARRVRVDFFMPDVRLERILAAYEAHVARARS